MYYLLENLFDRLLYYVNNSFIVLFTVEKYLGYFENKCSDNFFEIYFTGVNASNIKHFKIFDIL